jgi:nitrogen regulatory protein PII
MKQIVAIVKPFRAQEVLEAIGEFDADTVLVHEAKGFGRQKDRLSEYRGSEFNLAYLPKIEIQVLASDEQAEKIADRIVGIARTGRIGDGKIMMFPVVGHVDL